MKRFSISDIESLTGIKAHTIRVWEQRYNLVAAKRTESNIRYYTSEDLCTFLNIATLNENGYKISKISQMDISKINQLVKSLRENHYNVNVQVQMLSNAMFTMDETEFDDILNGCINEMGMEKAMHDIFFPFLNKVGFMWQVGSINPAHEHFATQKISQKIIHTTYENAKEITSKSKRFLLFLPAGEIHEVGLLFAQYILKSRGHQVLYLGQNMPEDTLTEVANYYEPDCVFSVLTSPLIENDINKLINRLLENLPYWPLVLAGSQVVSNPINPKPRLTIIKQIAEFIEKVENHDFHPIRENAND